MTSKERAELKSKAIHMDSIFQIGKSSLTPQMTEAIRSALKARELIKISVLKNCSDDPNELARIIAERTDSQVVQVIGKKIVLYRLNPEKEKKRQKKVLAEKAEKKRKKLQQKKSGAEERKILQPKGRHSGQQRNRGNGIE